MWMTRLIHKVIARGISNDAEASKEVVCKNGSLVVSS